MNEIVVIISRSSSTNSSIFDLIERPRPSGQAPEIDLVVDRIAGQTGPPGCPNTESPEENERDALDSD